MQSPGLNPCEPLSGRHRDLSVAEIASSRHCDRSADTPAAGIYDEMLAAPATRARTGSRSVDAIGALGTPELTPALGAGASGCIQRERRHLQRLRRPARHATGPGSSIPMPLLIAADEWRTLEAGLRAAGAAARTSMLADLYGPQRLLHDGLLPPELVFAHPGLPASLPRHAVPPGALSASLRRRPGARRPTAAGGCSPTARRRRRAPATRSRTASSCRACCPRSSATARCSGWRRFFRTLRDTLRDSRRATATTRASCCSRPGPYNETYFEHAYLARYLGYTLVEGGDLTVRDNRVFLKTLGGLQPVDVILRRLDDDFCDPLELRGDSFARRAGPGAGGARRQRRGRQRARQRPGRDRRRCMPFLPGLCRQLLGEELLHAVGARPGGAATRRGCALRARRPRAAGRSSRPSPARGREPIFGDAARRDEPRRSWSTGSARGPDDFVAQERVALSTAPVLERRPARSRATSCCARSWRRAATAIAVMPGGLTRVAAVAATRWSSRCSAAAAARTPGCSPTGRSAPFSAAARRRRSRSSCSRGGSDLPSRVADNLFWLGRYAERAEGSARLLRGILVRLTRASRADRRRPSCRACCRALPQQAQIAARLRRSKRPSCGWPTLERKLLHRRSSIDDQPGSLRATLAASAARGRDGPRPHLARHLADAQPHMRRATSCRRRPTAHRPGRRARATLDRARSCSLAGVQRPGDRRA